MMKNKKGQLGFNIIVSIFIVLMALVVTGIVVILISTNLTNVADNIDKVSVTLTNDTTASVVNYTGAYPTTLLTHNRVCSLTITYARIANLTNIDASNYTISGCKILANLGATGTFNNSNWNITGVATYSGDEANSISRNASSGVASFFGNITTILSIMVIVIIILAISIVIRVVRGFGGESSGSQKSFGSDTVMGI